MFSIYEDAFITIAATSAPDDKGGCMVTRRRWSMGSGEREVINAFSVISGTIYSLYFGSDYTMTDSARHDKN